MHGTSSPTAPAPRRRWGALRLAIIFTVGGLMLWTLQVSDFVSSPFGQGVALAIAIGVGLLTAFGTWFDPVLDDAPYQANMIARFPFMQDRRARTAAFAILATLLTFLAVNGAGLEFWTLAMGHPGERSLHLGAYRSAYRNTCAGFTLQEAPFTTHSMICARYPDGATPAPTGTSVAVWGPASDVGIRVERFQIEPS